MAEWLVSQKSNNALAKLLVKLGHIRPEQISGGFVSPDYLPIAFFSKLGVCIESEVVASVAQDLHLEIWKLDKRGVAQALGLLAQTPFERIPLATWRQIRALPISIADGVCSVAMANPLDTDVRTSLEFELGIKVAPRIGSETEILSVLADKQGTTSGFELSDILQEGVGESSSGATPTGVVVDSNETSHDVSAPPVVRLVDKIFSDGIAGGASDIHLTPERDLLIVKIRVDGLMRQLFTVPASMTPSVISRIKLLGGMDISERRKPQDGRFRLKSGYGIKDLRMSVLPTAYGENVVVRVLSSDLSAVSFDSLGMGTRDRELLGKILRGSSRVILVSGPTGSGKTSTLYASLLSLRDGETSIVTIEDPIEYRMQGVTQSQVNPKTGLTFAEGLRSILRQDPDVIMVGEIRDGETASIAMQCAQTGHLVLSTIHTNSAASVVTRLKDLGVPAYIVASSVGGIVAQRLVRTLCPHCKVKMGAQESQALEARLGSTAGGACAPVGCGECGGSGYKGRVGVFSILEVSEVVREAIRTEKGEREIETLGESAGFRSLEQASVELILGGVTTLDEVERAVGPISVQAKSLPVASGSNPAVERLSPVPMRKRRILLVEDDENIRMVIGMLLQREFFEVIEASNGYEGLEKVFAAPPDLIVCDLMMPKMDGLAMIQRVRADSRTSGLPILMLTANSSEENEERIITSGADDFLSKTTKSEVLLARINRLLARTQI